ncbi:cytochrome c oxidase assembly protein [Zunongwangia sp. F363]|uniref:Cytochrome c oxidase assembly protein n=1 Tax=Autumnicola tepida TaxID=3075595 RepID=A0ABU3C649_9FLAO|nr:cytochrome c oxidase assembly protein [Zunongwangia sp. F363]MDT0641807.1 cytochrome c oxidase assembly protein [Zunongwangia sp. F363]
MSWKDYFLLSQNWSFSWSVALLIFFGSYLIWFKPKGNKLTSFTAAFLLLFIMTASPVANLLQFGLHSVAMLQHVIILMVIPILIWAALPSALLKKQWLKPENKNRFVLLTWLTGSLGMWAAHFLSAAKISAESGLSICGIKAAPGSWVQEIPDAVLPVFLLLAGIIFLIPVYSKDKNLRLKPLGAVFYLFAACVSCSILGLWVAFSASSAGHAYAAPMLTTLRSPLSLNLQSDQELAGMIMWVPGCVLYVATSVHIALNWLQGEGQGAEELVAAEANSDLKNE